MGEIERNPCIYCYACPPRVAELEIENASLKEKLSFKDDIISSMETECREYKESLETECREYKESLEKIKAYAPLFGCDAGFHVPDLEDFDDPDRKTSRCLICGAKCDRQGLEP